MIQCCYGLKINVQINTSAIKPPVVRLGQCQPPFSWKAPRKRSFDRAIPLRRCGAHTLKLWALNKAEPCRMIYIILTQPHHQVFLMKDEHVCLGMNHPCTHVQRNALGELCSISVVQLTWQHVVVLYGGKLEGHLMLVSMYHQMVLCGESLLTFFKQQNQLSFLFDYGPRCKCIIS